MNQRAIRKAGRNVDEETEKLADLTGLQDDATNQKTKAQTSIDNATKPDPSNRALWKVLIDPLHLLNFASGTLGGGKLVRDFGTESLAKLHGKEAVLTESQLANMAKGIYDAGANSSGGNVTLGGLEILNETVIMLNKNAEKTAKLIDTLVDVQKKAYNKMPGNKLV